jgi:hypothetical protein
MIDVEESDRDLQVTIPEYTWKDRVKTRRLSVSTAGDMAATSAVYVLYPQTEVRRTKSEQNFGYHD